MDKDDHLLLDFAASAESKQCAVVYPHFGYHESEDGPDKWDDLSEHYKTCGIGQEQSPIDLTNATPADLENIVFNYGETAVNILNNGHTIQVDKIQGSHIVIKEITKEITYALKQFHFHAPSEHTVDGQPYPIEMHLVHKDADDNFAVVAVFISQGAENTAFTPAWDYLPEDETPGAIATGTSINVAALLPADQTVYRYKGSLTTPPCSENVIWSVMNNPIEMSADQIAAFTSIISRNNRPLQPLNARDFQLDQTP